MTETTVDLPTLRRRTRWALIGSVLPAGMGMTASFAATSLAAEDITGVADEAVTWRLSQAAEARNKAVRSQQEDRAEYELGDNGAQINRSEREEFDALLDRITFSKPRR